MLFYTPTLRPLNSSQELKYSLAIMYVRAAQYDNPPYPPVNKICSAIDGAPVGNDILGRVAAGFNASFLGNYSCHNIFDYSELSNKSAWDWQVPQYLINSFL